MGRSRLVLGLAGVLVMSVAACSASSDDSGGSSTDAGKKDSGAVDGSTTDAGADGGAKDSGPSGSETGPSDSGGGGTCDQHTGDECNLVKQNCADSTKTCVYDGDAKHNVCATLATGTKLKGEACAAQGDCDKGLFCYGGKCSPACCSGDNSVCGPGGACNLALTDKDGTVVWHACTYSAKCNPFKYDCPKGQVCLFSSEPDVFKCSEPSKTGALGVAPGGSCKYVNDCGESQACFTMSSGDAGSGGSCMLFCWLTPPSGFTPGTTPDGRFPADGNCTIGGKSYGTCKAAGSIGGGLGICQP